MIIIMITIIKYTDALLNNRYFHRIPLNIFNKNGTRGVQVSQNSGLRRKAEMNFK